MPTPNRRPEHAPWPGDSLIGRGKVDTSDPKKRAAIGALGKMVDTHHEANVAAARAEHKRNLPSVEEAMNRVRIARVVHGVNQRAGKMVMSFDQFGAYDPAKPANKYRARNAYTTKPYHYSPEGE